MTLADPEPGRENAVMSRLRRGMRAHRARASKPKATRRSSDEQRSTPYPGSDSSYSVRPSMLPIISEMIELNGTLTLADFERFHYFYALRRAWPILAVVLLVTAVILSLVIVAPDPGIIANTRPLLILFAVYICLLAINPLVAARRQLAQQPYLREPLRQIFTATGIKTSSLSTSSEFKWNVVQNVHQTGQLFLLYYAPSQAVIVPKRLFSTPEQIESWLRFVEISIAPKKVSRPGVIGAWF